MKVRATAIFAALLIAALWAFPKVWYTKTAAGDKFLWLGQNTNLNGGWKFEPQAVDKSAEAILVADRLAAGEFRRNTDVVRVFGADRFTARQNDIGLFTHTPDRCWVQAGWKIEPAAPDALELMIHGQKIQVERRIYSSKGHRELVYFWGMSSGQTLPFRLDHNLNTALQQTATDASNSRAGVSRAADKKFWGRVWDSFASRRPFAGPKQFFRISTPAIGADTQAEEKLLAEIANQWLQPADFQAEAKVVSAARK